MLVGEQLLLYHQIKTLKKMDKDRFRQGLGDVVESYHQVVDRLGMNIIVD